MNQCQQNKSKQNLTFDEGWKQVESTGTNLINVLAVILMIQVLWICDHTWRMTKAQITNHQLKCIKCHISGNKATNIVKSISLMHQTSPIVLSHRKRILHYSKADSGCIDIIETLDIFSSCIIGKNQIMNLVYRRLQPLGSNWTLTIILEHNIHHYDMVSTLARVALPTTI